MKPGTRPMRLAVVLGASFSVLAGLLTLPVSSAAAAPVSSKAAVKPAPSEGQWERLGKVSEKHSALGVFGEPDDSEPVLTVPSGTSAEQKAKIKGEIPAGMNVRVKVSRFTQDKVNKIEDKVMARKWHSDADTYSVSSRYDGQSDKVIVQTDAPLSATDSLRATYGDAIEVRQARFEPQTTRFTDFAPWNGGTALLAKVGNSYFKCTGGFAVESTVTHIHYMTTAAHCYPAGTSVYARQYNNTSGNKVGFVDQRYTTMDTELITGSGLNYNSYIFTGGYQTSAAEKFVLGSDTPYQGLRVCVSGSVSFNHCGHPVSNTSFSICWSGSSVCINQGRGFLYNRGGTNFPYYNNGRVTQGGDSGAPIYTTDHTDSAAFISGMHAGLIGDVCCANAQMVGVKWSAMKDQLHLALVTS